MDKGVGRCSCYFVFVLNVDDDVDDAYGRETMMLMIMLMMMTTCSLHVACIFVCVPNSPILIVIMMMIHMITKKILMLMLTRIA